MRFLIITILFISTNALAQDSLISIPEGLLPKLIAFFIGAQIMFAGMGKGLTMIAEHTETKYDNIVANAFTKAAWYMGAFIGKMGWGMPKSIILKEAEKHNSGVKQP